MMNLILILSHMIKNQGREAFIGDYEQKHLVLAYIWTFTNQFLSNFFFMANDLNP